MSMFREWRRRRWRRRYPLPDPLWAQTAEQLPVLYGLAASDLERLRALVTVFLREKSFSAAAELSLTPGMQLRIAAQACLPVLNLGLDWYLGWETVIVYPGMFAHRRREVDETGLVHEWDQVMSGEAWEQGPVILSWDDVSGSGRQDSFNVVIHELAHKLDMLNGLPDGFPPLHRDMRVDRWSQVFTEAFEDMNRRLDAGHTTRLDPYAAEHPAEFFAVLSEYFFELPALLQREYPDVYSELKAFYRQDPLTRIAVAS